MDHSPALTILAEDEALFRDSVREFAQARVRPLVREMDEQAKIPRDLVDDLCTGTDHESAHARAQAIAYDLHRPHAVVVVQGREPVALRLGPVAEIDPLIKAWRGLAAEPPDSDDAWAA